MAGHRFSRIASPGSETGFAKLRRGTLHVGFEEGGQAAWLYDLIHSRVVSVIVCDPRRIVRQGKKADKTDAKRLAELLRMNGLKAIYHGQHGTRAVKELPTAMGPLSGTAHGSRTV